MSYLELYASDSRCYFSGDRGDERAPLVVLGVPFDSTSSYRAGSRFAPQRIREASQNIETFSLRARVDLEDVCYFDAGDIATLPDPAETLRRVERVVSELARGGRRVLILGGEHTITLGAVRGLLAAHCDIAVLVLDAHLDMRDEYPGGQRLSHATVVRRLVELVGGERVVVLGARALSREELEAAEELGLRYLTPSELSASGARELAEALTERSARLYLSIDLDVVDPAYAPAVQNPEVEGVCPSVVLDVIYEVSRAADIVGMDIVEYAPPYDASGATAVLAAKLATEALIYMWASKR